jgi:hypothetical protein
MEELSLDSTLLHYRILSWLGAITRDAGLIQGRIKRFPGFLFGVSNA